MRNYSNLAGIRAGIVNSPRFIRLQESINSPAAAVRSALNSPRMQALQKKMGEQQEQLRVEARQRMGKLIGKAVIVMYAMLAVVVFFLVRVRFKEESRVPPSAFELSSSVFCEGPILEAIAHARIFNDSKTFVDMPLLVDPIVAQEAFASLFLNGDSDSSGKADSGDSWSLLPFFQGDILAKTNYNDMLKNRGHSHHEPPKDDRYRGHPVPREKLIDWLAKYFGRVGSDLLPWVPDDHVEMPEQIATLKNATIRNWISDMNQLWLLLGRQTTVDVRKHPERHSLIWLPNPMIVPGGRFIETYYWDSYWIVLGLIRSGMVDTAMGIVQNMMHLLDTFGFIPNGSRVYYALPGRSQPPLFSSMVREVFAATGNMTFLSHAYSSLKREYAWWMQSGEYGHAVYVKGPAVRQYYQNSSHVYNRDDEDDMVDRMDQINYDGDTVHVLNRYVTDQHIPRPESFYEDKLTAIEAGFSPTEPEAQILYSEIAAAAESGWDFSARWFGDRKTLATCRTSQVIPVDLNSMMYVMESDLAAFATTLADYLEEKCQEVHYKIAEEATRAMDDAEDDLASAQTGASNASLEGTQNRAEYAPYPAEHYGDGRSLPAPEYCSGRHQDRPICRGTAGADANDRSPPQDDENPLNTKGFPAPSPFPISEDRADDPTEEEDDDKWGITQFSGPMSFLDDLMEFPRHRLSSWFAHEIDAKKRGGKDELGSIYRAAVQAAVRKEANAEALREGLKRLQSRTCQKDLGLDHMSLIFDTGVTDFIHDEHAYGALRAGGSNGGDNLGRTRAPSVGLFHEDGDSCTGDDIKISSILQDKSINLTPREKETLLYVQTMIRCSHSRIQRLRDDALRYSTAAKARAVAINSLMWDEEEGKWSDLVISPEVLPRTVPTGVPRPEHPTHDRGTVPVPLPSILGQTDDELGGETNGEHLELRLEFEDEAVQEALDALEDGTVQQQDGIDVHSTQPSGILHTTGHAEGYNTHGLANAHKRKKRAEDIPGHFFARSDLEFGKTVFRAKNITTASDFTPLWAGLGGRYTLHEPSIVALNSDDPKFYQPFGHIHEGLDNLYVNKTKIMKVLTALHSTGVLDIGGISATNIDTVEQWDRPNGWAPLQHMLILGLNSTGVKEAQKVAQHIAKSWMYSNLLGYRKTGYMHEKYRTDVLGQGGGGGEYVPQTGFGWSNGVAIDLAMRYNFDDLEL